MRNNRFGLYLIILFFAMHPVFLTVQAQEAGDSHSSAIDGKYINRLLKFTVKSPGRDWKILDYSGLFDKTDKLSAEQLKKLQSLKKGLSPDDSAQKAKIDKNINDLKTNLEKFDDVRSRMPENSGKLFSLIRTGGNAPVVMTGRYYSMEEGFSSKNEADFLRISAPSTTGPGQDSSKIKTTSLGGKKFYYTDHSIDRKNLQPGMSPMKYRTCCTKMQGYLLVLTMLFPAEEEAGVIQDLSGSIRFGVN